MCSTLEYGRREGIVYDELPGRQLLYSAGQLKRGAYPDYREKLHLPENVVDLSSVPSNPSQPDRQRDEQQASDEPSSTTSFGNNNDTVMNDIFLTRIQQSHT